MKTLATICAILCATIAMAQEPAKTETKEERKQRYIEEVNPFEKYGYRPKIATLSKGKYREAFPDTIVQIGSFTYNRLTKKIIGITITEENDYNEDDLRPDLTSRWFSPDPLSDEFPSWSPYNFVENNPIRFIDPEGLSPFDVVITGDLADEAVDQLNASSNLEITRNAETGKLSATGKAKSKADKTLLKAINDENITVNLNATSSNTTTNASGETKDLIIGKFGGNVVNEDGTVTAAADVNPNQTAIAGEFYETEGGVYVTHEILESYNAAVKSPGTGQPGFDGIQNKTPNGRAFLKAHKKALKQDRRFVEPTIIGENSNGTGVYKLQKLRPVPGVTKPLPFEVELFKKEQ